MNDEILDLQTLKPMSIITVPLWETTSEPREEVARSQSEAKSSSELALHFAVDKKTIQTWYKVIAKAYLWLSKTELKFGCGKYLKYTPLCIQLMSALKSATATGKTFEEWVNEIHSIYPEQIDSYVAQERTKVQTVIPPNPSTLLVTNIDSDLYALIEQELERQKVSETLTLETLESVEAELVECNQQWQQSQNSDREVQRRANLQQAIQDAIADEKDYQQTYIATRNRLRKTKQ